MNDDEVLFDDPSVRGKFNPEEAARFLTGLARSFAFDPDEVGFGRIQELDALHRGIRYVLKVATEKGPDYACLTDWEDDWCRDNLKQVEAHGNKWELTPKRKEVLRKVMQKLEGDNLLSGDDLATSAEFTSEDRDLPPTRGPVLPIDQTR